MSIKSLNKITTTSVFIVLLLMATNLKAQQLKQPLSVGPHIITLQKNRPVRNLKQSNIEIKDPADTLEGWKLHWVGGLHGSQASYSNWSSGGVNALSATASTLFDALFRKNKWGYHLEIELRYGRSRLDDQGSRKTDDQISILNKVTRRFNDERWHAFALVNFDSQFDQGFNYDVPDGKERELISGFWRLPM